MKRPGIMAPCDAKLDVQLSLRSSEVAHPPLKFLSIPKITEKACIPDPSQTQEVKLLSHKMTVGGQSEARRVVAVRLPCKEV